MLITGEVGSGKTSLIAKWLAYHKLYHQKDNNLVIYQNPSLTSTASYSETLFEILHKLRQEYDYPVKTPILEEKLKLNFVKLFENSNILQTPNTSRKCVVIIIDGVDIFKENLLKEESAEWLPCNTHEDLKVIYTCSLGSEAESVLCAKCKVINIKPLILSERKKILKELIKKFTDYEHADNLRPLKRFVKASKGCANPFFLKMVIFWALSSFPAAQQFLLPIDKEVFDLPTLLLYAINAFSKYCNNAIYKVLGCLSICKYSLTREEIALSAGVSLKCTLKVLQVFDIILFKHEDLYCLSNHIFRQIIAVRLPVNLPKELALTLEENKNQKRVNEMIHALYISNNWKHLKDKLKEISNFAYFYNQRCRLHLCKYWAALEENGFDPVDEYNKTIEDFYINNPILKPEDGVLVLLIFCSFFEEYGDFECPKLNIFRNYPLVHEESLQELNIFAELEKIDGIFNCSPLSPLLESERFLLEELKPEIVREKIVVPEKRRMNFSGFHYRRWLWIQFLWVSLNPSISASQYLSKLKGVVENVSYLQEKEMFEKFTKLVAPEANPAKTLKNRPQTSKPGLQRARSLSKYINSMPKQSMLNDSSTGSRNSASKDFLNLSNLERRPQTYCINFSLRDTEINTVLLKLDSQLVRFSQTEFQKRHKETLKLQQQYNKLIQLQRIKEKEIEGISTMISQLEAKGREKEEVIQRINFLQFQINKNLEKLTIATSEGEYLVKIYNCGLKNPPFRNEWTTDIVRAIENCNAFMANEQEQIERYVHDKFQYDLRSGTLKPLMAEKKVVGNTTLSKLSEKYSLNAYINKNIVKGFNRRKLLLIQPESKDSASLNLKIKHNSDNGAKIHVTKVLLEKKIADFQAFFEKLAKLNIEDKEFDLNSIINRIQNQANLIEQKVSFEKSIEELKIEKTHLEEKLNYLLTSRPQLVEEEEEEHRSYNEVSIQLDSTIQKVAKLKEKVVKQELDIIKLKESISLIWKRAKISESCNLEKSSVKSTLRTIAESIEKMQTPMSRPPMREERRNTVASNKIWNALSFKKILPRKSMELPTSQSGKNTHK